MALDPDPYRILELKPGATLDEVRRAYRRLAKVHHPDAAGEAALPRFLAIQAAYEQLLIGAPPGARGRRASGAPRRAWEADPDRSDATRRAYGGRARTAPPGGATAGKPGSAARPGTDGPGSGTRGSGASGAAGAPGAGSRGPAPGRSRRRRASADGSSPGQEGPPNPDAGRSRRTKRSKATLGSTSYDGADGPFEPDWRGASWYGTTSGTYWTLNPKEYADPRKHGPEYQARARRSVRARPPEVGATDATAGSAGEPGPGENAPAGEPGGPGQGPVTNGRPVSEPIADPAAGPTHTTSSWWNSTTGPAAASSGGGSPETEPFAAEAGAWAGDRRPPPAVDPPPDLGRAVEDIVRALTDERLGGVRGRVARAVIGWLPVAFGIGWIAGELTGCGRFAATCDGSADPLVMILQVAVLALLLVVPVVASIATMATLALFGAAIVAALILSATGSAADGDSRRVALGAVLLVAWFVGLAIAVVRRLRTLSSPTRPVS